MKKVRVTIPLLVILALLILQGCGADSAAGETSPAAATESAASSETPAVTEAPTADASGAPTPETTEAPAPDVSDAPTPEVTEAPTAEAAPEDTELVLTLEELAQYNGKDGNPAYIAVDGVIYDVTDVSQWKNGSHNGFEAGNDLTDAIKNVSPHGVSKLKDLPVVGKLAD